MEWNVVVLRLLQRLGDWMACAGVDLELADEKIRTYHPLEKTLGTGPTSLIV